MHGGVEKEGRGVLPAAVAWIQEEGLAAGLLSSLAAVAASLTGRRADRRRRPGVFSEGEGVNEFRVSLPTLAAYIRAGSPPSTVSR
jgi:hypothetical protein